MIDRKFWILSGSVAIVLLNVIDALITLWGLHLGVIEEVNPIMSWLIAKSSVAFIGYKLALPVILGLIFWRIRNRSRRLVKYGMVLVLMVYAVVVGMNVWVAANW